VLAVGVSPDGAQVVTSGFETQLHWWDAKTAERLRRTGGPGVAVHELAFDARGTVLAVAGGDGTVRFYDPKTGNQLRAAQVGSPVFALALDPAGKRLASGTADGLVKLWDVADARLLVTLWSGGPDHWLSLTPQGYYTTDEGLATQAVWTAGSKPVPDAKLLAPLADARKVGQALAGQKLTDPLWK
jgi:WD40 repeat protein